MSDIHDIAIVGSAFAGSLTAMIACRLGRSVVLVERGRHPRFAIGESSTPLANLLLEDLATRYDLPRLRPFVKHGAWRRAYPEVACGLKRGFSFYHHIPGEPFVPMADRGNELLVAASPDDELADTHWFRPDFDHFFQREAGSLGATYLDETHLDRAEEQGDHMSLSGTRLGKPVAVRARFVVDASGPRGFLHRALGLGEVPFAGYPETEALYSHFTGVRCWDELHPAAGQAPFPVDDAALHHVFPGGWIWVLRFGNGITSAGVSMSRAAADEIGLADGAPAWGRLLARLPSVAAQFVDARPVRGFTHAPRLSFRSAQSVGRRWAMLPSSAGFIDPLLSTGFPLTLLGVERIARMLEDAPVPAPGALAAHAIETDGDLTAAAALIGALLGRMDRPADLHRLLMLYFAAASFSETARRLGRPGLAGGFLLRKHPTFGADWGRIVEDTAAGRLAGEALSDAVDSAIAPIDVGGWNDPGRRNWYPVAFAPLFAAADRLGTSRAGIRAMLVRAGVAASAIPSDLWMPDLLGAAGWSTVAVARGRKRP